VIVLPAVAAVLGATAAPARAGIVYRLETTLAVSSGTFPPDDPSVDRNVEIVQEGANLRITSAGDTLDLDPSVVPRCSHPGGRLDTAVCDAGSLTELSVFTAAGDDHITADTALLADLCGGRGDDVLTGGPGSDLLAGAAGDDTLVGGGGDDFLRADRVPFPDPTDPTCSALPGDAPGVNTLDGGPGGDVLAGDDGSDTMDAGPGEDQLSGRAGDDRLDGGEDQDLLVGGDGGDTLAGGPDKDALSGGPGNDRLAGEEGDDRVGVAVLAVVDRGGALERSLEEGDDRLDGGPGDDELVGGPGDATVAVGADPGVPLGGEAPNGADTISGGPGNDLVSYRNRTIPVRVSLDGQADDGTGDEHDDVLPDIERVAGGSAADGLIGGPGRDELDGGLGADVIAGGDGDDVLSGGLVDEGTDVVSGGAGADAIDGGPGPDALAGEDGDDVLHGGGGDDHLDGGAGADDLQGEADGDTLAGGPGPDTLDGGPGTDVADYSGVSPVWVTLDDVRNDGEAGEDWVRDTEDVRGGSAADRLTGDALPNRLEGGGGDDDLEGGGGPDELSAGPGADVVRARDGGRDVVACGAGPDLALIDEIDTLREGGERCERADAGLRARRGEALLRPDGGCAPALRLPGLPRGVVVTGQLSLPARTRVEATACAVTLVAAGRRAPRATASGGTFELRRPGDRRRALQLRMLGGGFAACGTAAPSSGVRRLEVRARGRVQVLARFATTATRRATWTVADRCDGTLTRVRRQRVRVTPVRAGHGVTVKAGHARLIRAPRTSRRP
jgi:Ca2+-binding RTX toxin-like protein